MGYHEQMMDANIFDGTDGDLEPDALDDNYADLVDRPEDACPDCGESRVDWLAWDEDGESVTCASCGCRYVP